MLFQRDPKRAPLARVRPCGASPVHARLRVFEAMIHHRAQGISHLVVACQCLLVEILFWIWFLLYSWLVQGSLDITAYALYSVVICAGLWLELLTRNNPAAVFPARRPSLTRQIPRALRQCAIAVGFLLLVLVLSKDRYLSRLFLFSLIPALYPLLLLSGNRLPAFLGKQLFRGTREERMILIGSPKRAYAIRDWLRTKREYGFHAVGILTDDASFPNPSLKVLGTPQELDAKLSEFSITQVILLQLPDATAEFDQVFETVRRHGTRLLILSNLDEQLRHPVLPFEDEGLKFFAFHREPLENPFNRLLKRTMDLCIAVPAALLVLPVASLLVWIAHRTQSPGPLLHRQIRAGIQNRNFEILKFRTMYENTADIAKQATEGDGRIFPLGHWLRRFSIDELPQFLNVIAGTMSAVGPRPHLGQHNALFAEALSEYHVRSFVKPGMTGLAQVRGFRGEAKSRMDISARLQSDLEYLQNWSPILDCSIISRTIWHVIFPPKTAR
jgi:exopolysaccharide biosynthesis polyprenyl glycosylphosphotransferase